ncbi:MAG: MarC family protein [Planctomycetaceae bacterium]|nr:MarC family protein [Planctomycetaceae bacterium]
MSDFFRAIALLLALLNPFLVVVYLLDVIQTLDRKAFRSVLIRAVLIAGAVFGCFALAGDAIFSGIVQAEFASFQIFGGIVFLLIGLQFVFRGPTAIEILRGESKYLAGAIAMPVLIGPGTLSASVIVGKQLPPLAACGAIVLALTISVAVIILLKSIHDHVRTTNADLIQRYIEIAGRITALYVGTVSIEMIMLGLRSWLQKF